MKIVLIVLTLLSGSVFASGEVDIFNKAYLNYDKTVPLGTVLDEWENCKNTNYTSTNDKISFECELKIEKYYFQTLQSYYQKYYKNKKTPKKRRTTNHNALKIERLKIELKGLQTEQQELLGSNANIKHKAKIINKEQDLQAKKNTKHDDDLKNKPVQNHNKRSTNYI